MSELLQTASRETLDRYKIHDAASSALLAKELASDKEGNQEVYIHREPSSNQLLLVFTGMAAQAGGIPLVDFHQSLTKFHKVNIIYFSDHQRMAYVNGISQMANSLEGTVQEIRKLQAFLNINQTLCMGMSAGGFCAILYGAKLGAKKVMCFGSYTSLEEEVYVNDKRARAARRIREICPENERDLRVYLMNHPKPPEIHLHYSELMDFDKQAAEHLAGLPCVTLHPLAGSVEHAVLPQLVRRGKIRDVLSGFFA